MFILAADMCKSTFGVIHPLLRFVWDYETLALPRSGDVMEPNCVCMVDRIHVVNQFLFEAISNSDNQKGCHLIIAAQHCSARRLLR